MKKINTFPFSFSLKPCRLVYFAGEVPGQKGAEVVDQKVEKKAETLEDKQKQLKDGLQKAEQKVAELQKKVDERKDDKTFQETLTARKLDIKVQLADALKKIGEIKAGLEKAENADSNAKTLEAIQKVLAPIASAVDDADMLKEFNDGLEPKFTADQAARGEAFTEARAGKAENAEVGKEFKLKNTTNLFDNIGKNDGRISGVLEKDATVKIIDAKMMSVATKGDLVDATGFDKDSVHQWVRVEGKFKSGVNGKGPEKTFKGWIPWELIKPEAVKGEVETKPVETKPVETKPVETKPVETKPVETKPVETKPVEIKELKQEDIDKALEELAKLGIKITEPKKVEKINDGQVKELKDLGEWMKKLVEGKSSSEVVKEKLKKQYDEKLNVLFKDSPISKIDLVPKDLKQENGTPSKGFEWTKDEIKTDKNPEAQKSAEPVQPTAQARPDSAPAAEGGIVKPVELPRQKGAEKTVVTPQPAAQPAKVEVKKDDEKVKDINKTLEELKKDGIQIVKPEPVKELSKKQVDELKKVSEFLKKLVGEGKSEDDILKKFDEEKEKTLVELFKDSPVSQILFTPEGLKDKEKKPSKGLIWGKTMEDAKDLQAKLNPEAEQDKINKEFEAKQNAIKDKLIKIDTDKYKVTPKGNSLTEFNIKQKDGDKIVGYVDVNAVKDPMTCDVKLIGYPSSGGDLVKTFSIVDTNPDDVGNILKENMPKHLKALGAPEDAKSKPYEGKITSPEEIARIDGMLQKMDPIKPEDLGKQWVDENQAAAMQRLLGPKFVEQVYVVKGAKFPDDIADIMSPKEKSLDKNSKGYEMRVLLAKRQAELQKKVV